jgi:serine/threonine protein kinase
VKPLLSFTHRQVHCTKHIVNAGTKTQVTLRGSTRHDNCVYYAAPEAIKAAVDSSTMQMASVATLVVKDALDVFAAGVIAFEALRGVPALDHETDVKQCALGSAQYPWERPDAQQPEEWRSAGPLRAVLVRCLSRNAAERPRAEQLMAELAEVVL